MALIIIAALCCDACARSVQVVRTPSTPVASAVSVNTTRQVKNAIDAGDGDFQARTLRARLDADPQDLSARLELARYYQRAGFPEVAIEHCRLACERAPESVEAHLVLAKLLRGAHRTAEGAAVLKDFSLTPAAEGSVEVYAWLGLLEDEAGDWKAGESAHRKAIELAPERDDLLNNLGYCLLEQGRKAEAADVFRRALQLNPKSVIARNNLGLAVADNPKEAVLNWQSTTDPASAHNNMAVALMEAGKYDEARREIQTALSYDPHHQAALNNLQLISTLDGKPAAFVTPSAGTGPRQARFWWHFWPYRKNKENPNGDSGGAIASK
jgi:Flp pilus assembly protein TadD